MATTVNYWGLTATQRACMTQVTRRMIGIEKGEPTPDMTNRKPYRSAKLKAEARAEAYKRHGAWVSPVHVIFHSAPRA